MSWDSSFPRSGLGPCQRTDQRNSQVALTESDRCKAARQPDQVRVAVTARPHETLLQHQQDQDKTVIQVIPLALMECTSTTASVQVIAAIDLSHSCQPSSNRWAWDVTLKSSRGMGINTHTHTHARRQRNQTTSFPKISKLSFGYEVTKAIFLSL